MTSSHSLNGIWELTYGRPTEAAPARPEDLARSPWPTIEAVVPGNVELDLMRAGRLDDPSVGQRIYALREWESFDWWYRRRFAAPSTESGQRVELVFEGLDCLGTIWLNGQCLGTADNMLIAHRFDVTDALRAGENELCVRIESAVRAARRRGVEPGEFASAVNYESLALRKAPHMFGWDILPRLVSAGLWRAVRLDVLPPARWRQVYFTTLAASPAQRTARVLVDWDFTTDRPQVDGLTVRVTLSAEDGLAHESRHAALGTHGRALIDLRDVRLWWPRGYGAPDLYNLRVELLDERGGLVDAVQQRVGIRTAALRRTDLTTPDGQGDFSFYVNGERIFVRGTNWVPLDSLHSRDSEHLPAAFDMLVDLNCNMVRCWGGNVYEDHPFFDLCDRHGVMVWQDFALGCAVYPQDDAFAKRLGAEAAAVVTKLRNHPSLVLWAGNNEVDEAYEWAEMGIDPNTDRLSRQVLPAVVRRLDPLRSYLPSSPYRPSAFFAQSASAADVLPEQHLWGPRDDFKGPTYAQSAAHFASEIGYHGCPDPQSLQRMMDPAWVWPWRENPQWLAHAVRPHPAMHKYDYRIPLMAKQIEVLFGGVPETLDDFVLASQISQAEALKFFIEWFRQGKWRRTGILWWNLRDGWPVISDAVVDYYNRKKLAYHYIRRVQTDVCVICAEAALGRHALVAVNDTRRPARGTAEVRDVDSQRLLIQQRFEVEPNGASRFGELPEAGQPAMWAITWALEEKGQAGRNHYLAGPRPFDLNTYRDWLSRLELQE